MLDCLETKYGVKVKERLVRRIVGGGVGPPEVCLEEIAPEATERDARRNSASPVGRDGHSQHRFGLPRRPL